VKVLGLAVTGLVVGLTARGRATGGSAEQDPRVLQVLVDAGLVAGTANLINLLDLRPGRALKATLLLGTPLAAAGSTAAAVVVGTSLAALPRDLAARTMLGDTGANALGAVLGTAAVDRLPRPGRWVVLTGLVALTLASERVSFSAVIAVQRQAYFLMGVLFTLAALTRLPGIVLIVPLGLTMFATARASRAGKPRSIPGAPRRRDWLWLAAGPIGLAGFLGFLWRLTGDPLSWLKAQDAWNHPPDTMAPTGMPSIPTTAIVLALVAVTARIVSMPRYLAVLWPFPWVLTSRRSNVFIAVSLTLCVVSFIGFAYLDFTVLAA